MEPSIHYRLWADDPSPSRPDVRLQEGMSASSDVPAQEPQDQERRRLRLTDTTYLLPTQSGSPGS